MLMAEMKRVASLQQQVLYKLKEVISTKLDKHQIGNSTFQVQHQVEDLLESFERSVILKFDELKASGAVGAEGTSPEDDKEVCPAPGGGRW